MVKNVAGFDLGKLLTGSLGTLGVMVEASLKLFPKPPECATFALRPGTLGIARDLRRSILRSPLDPLRLMLIDSPAAALLGEPAGGQDAGGAVVDGSGGSHRVIERCMLELRQMASAAGVPVVRVEGADEAWQRMADLAPWLRQKYRDVTVLKAALPLVASEEFLSRAQQESDAERVPLASFAQVGVGVVHLCALQETTSTGVEGWVGRSARSGRRPSRRPGDRALPRGTQKPHRRLGRGRRRSWRYAPDESGVGPPRGFIAGAVPGILIFDFGFSISD